MSDQHTIYPNLSWAQFEVFNDNRTENFEEMCKDLFICEYLKNSINPHANHNNPGVEVVPIQEPPRGDGQPQRFISYQAKYFESSISDSQIIHSLKEAVAHYAGKLDAIYLFCNKVISTGTERYKKYVSILSPANIKLELVTNKDIFALIRKYPRVADYYFQDRKRAVAGANSLMGAVTFPSSVSDAEPLSTSVTTSEILQELLKEKLKKCSVAIKELRFGELKSELDLLTKIGIDSTDNNFIYYRIIQAAHNRDDIDDLINQLSDGRREEAYWLKSFLKNIREINIDEFADLSAELQIVVLDLLFTAQHWACILDLHKGRDRISGEALKAFDFHYGLSLFNLGECEKSHEVLEALYKQYHEQRFKLYDICALLHKANREYVYGAPGQGERVKELLAKLDNAKETAPDQIKSNEPLIAILELQACFNLGATEKHYLDEAFVRYESYSNNTKSNDGVSLFVALCYDMVGNLEYASELLSKCDWKNNETVACRYMTNLIDQKKLEEARDVYLELAEETKSYRVESVFLLVLYRLNEPEYKSKLAESVNRCSSLEDLLAVGFYVEDRGVFDEVVLPKFQAFIPVLLPQSDIQVKIGVLAVLAHNRSLSLLEIVLSSFNNLQVINRFVTHDIYKCLFELANKEYEAWRHDKEVKSELKEVEQIAERFIEADIQKRDFLQIRLLCASANHMVYSMLKYSRELFEYTHDVQTARNIVALLYERNETNKDEYEPYLSTLMESDDPGICIAVASAMLKLGRYEDTDYYAYKAVYELNGEDDFDVYKSLFGYYNLTLLRIKEKPARKTISSNMIVTLDADGEQWIVALDSEDGFGNKDNHSLGVEHIGRTDPVYIKLIGKGRKQVLNLRNKSYRVVDFEPREFFLGRFIYQKIQEHPDEFKGTVWMISTENTDEMIKQILALSDHREQTKILVDAYNFGTNHLGIPIDFFIHGNYEKYIDAQRYLLYAKDLAYYAGEPRLEYIVDAKYIPALSTLVLLAFKGWLDTLDWLGNNIVIPESYMPFFKEQYALEVGSQVNSAGSLIPLEDGRFTILEPDKQLPEIWEAIINKCEKYPTEVVTDDERIAYEVLDGYTYERLFAGMKMDKVQLDALILAERLNGVYYCDDLFFRKLAAHKEVKNINFATLLYAHKNLDIVMPILIELSKTNYVYTPFRCRNNEEGQELINNLLEGEKKNLYYSEFFNTYIYVKNQIMKQYFGDNWEEDDEESNDEQA